MKIKTAIVVRNVFAATPDFDVDSAFKEYCKRKHEDKLHPLISFAHELRYRCEFARAHHFLDNHVN
jgi:hypothetical protein